jgi:hypothetical protein
LISKWKPKRKKQQQIFGWIKRQSDLSSANESVEGPLPSGFSRDLILLSAYRRVISNFVCILTNKSIPVHFSCDAKAAVNCTDGKRVWISASVKRKADFDWSVGLALHEAAHIKLSDFDIVRKVFGTTPLESAVSN